MWNTSSWILLNRIRLVVSQFPVFNLAVTSYLHADMREVAIASHLTLNKEANHCISQIKQKMNHPWCFFNAPSVAEGKNECIMKRLHSAHLRLYIHYFHVSSLFSFIAHCLFHSLFSLGGRSAHGLQQIREMLQAESQIIAHCLCGMAKNPPYSASFLAILSIFSEPSLNWQSHKTQKVCGTERVYKKKKICSRRIGQKTAFALKVCACLTHPVCGTVCSMFIVSGLVPLTGRDPAVHEPEGKVRKE